MRRWNVLDKKLPLVLQTRLWAFSRCCTGSLASRPVVALPERSGNSSPDLPTVALAPLSATTPLKKLSSLLFPTVTSLTAERETATITERGRNYTALTSAAIFTRPALSGIVLPERLRLHRFDRHPTACKFKPME
jgi:hypothetical protein